MNFLRDKRDVLRLNPPMILAIGFAVIILIGTFLLFLPISVAGDESVEVLDAFFTATSAVCVTGLVTVNTAATWSVFGKIVIICLIQIGGLGFMSFATIVMVILGRRIGLSERLILKEQLNADKLSGVVDIIVKIIKITLAIELTGAALISIRLVPVLGFERGVLYALFHSISAYCNAGFDIFGSSLEAYSSDVFLLLVFSTLVILGGLGFGVYLDLYKNRKTGHFRANTRFVLVITAALLIIGCVSLLVLEYSNSQTIGEMGFVDKLSNTFFQSTIARTAGFNSINIGALRDSSVFLFIMLMFIGGSPGSTAGGLKTTTFGVLMAAMLSEIRGEEDTIIYKRTIPERTIKRALAVTMISIMLVMTVTFVLTLTEQSDFLDTLFETVSGFATVGVSRGLSENLTGFGKILMSFTMYLGRIGPMTLAFAIGKKQKQRTHKYAYGNISVG